MKQVKQLRQRLLLTMTDPLWGSCRWCALKHRVRSVLHVAEIDSSGIHVSTDAAKHTFILSISLNHGAHGAAVSGCHFKSEGWIQPSCCNPCVNFTFKIIHNFTAACRGMA